MKNSSNPSVLRSQQWIYESLLKLMDEKPFDKITIGEITKNAQLDRTTFYRNFESKQDILNFGIVNIRNKYFQAMDDAHSLNMKYLSTSFFSICLEEKEFFILIHKQGLSSFLLNQFNSILPSIHSAVKDKFNYQIKEEYLIYALYYNTGGFLNILMKWIDDGCTGSVDELVESFIEISRFNISE